MFVYLFFTCVARKVQQYQETQFFNDLFGTFLVRFETQSPAPRFRLRVNCTHAEPFCAGC